MSQLKIVSRARKLVAFAALLSAGIVAFAGSAHATNLLVNGTFDVQVPDNATGGGWTTVNLLLSSSGWNNAYGNPAPALLLNNHGYDYSEPSIYKTVTGLSVGADYIISGEYGLGWGPGSGANSFEVRVDGVDVLQLGPHPDHDPASGTYYPFRGFSVTFTATATSHTILFAAECNGTDHDYFVDNLSLEIVTVQVEASTWGKIKALYH